MPDVASHQEFKFYTTGFTGKDLNDLKPMLDFLDAVQIDVRFSPHSELIRWRQVYLKALLREKYRHIAQLGARAARSGEHYVQHLDLGIKVLLSFRVSAVLMCECADFNYCHRQVIAKELRRRGFRVMEIDDWKPAAVIS